MYTMLNNKEASKFDLYLPGKLVASLHYKIDDNVDEVMFVYCEAIDATDPDTHCRVLMKKALEETHARWLRVNVTCPIALKHMRHNASLESSRAAERHQRSRSQAKRDADLD